MSILVQLRFVGGELWKGLPLVALLITVKFGDIGAYAVGRTLGRNRAVPQLSPGKTVEGFVGGLAFSVGGAFLACRFLPVWASLIGRAIFLVAGDPLRTAGRYGRNFR